ncbi:unnamed protein product, partial [Rotaria sp. Silwood2]
IINQFTIRKQKMAKKPITIPSIAIHDSVNNSYIINLNFYSHEECVAVIEETYLEQLTKEFKVSIEIKGTYAPLHLEQFCIQQTDPRLRMVIKLNDQIDEKKVYNLITKIGYDLSQFKDRDRAAYQPNTHTIVLYGSLFNSLDHSLFDFGKALLGDDHCNIKRIENALGIKIYCYQTMKYRYRFEISHKEKDLMQIGATMMQALVQQQEIAYRMAYILTEDTTISISTNGEYVPMELESMYCDENPSRLQLIIKSEHEYDKKLEDISTEIFYNFLDRPSDSCCQYDYDSETNRLQAYGCIYNILPISIFDTNRYLLGEENSKIKEIENILGCSIVVDQISQTQYSFTIS